MQRASIKMLDWGKLFNVHLRRDQLKTPDVSGDPGTCCWHLHLRGSCKHYTYLLSNKEAEDDRTRNEVGSVAS